MTERRDNLLKIIVEEYIKTAQPVGSKFICDNYLSDVSPATIRNDMVQLEENGHITQPHTSAGRIPTALGYQYYLQLFGQEGELSKKNQEFLNQISKKIAADRAGFKELAKAVAEISNQAVLVGFEPNDVYYTGISNLFRQPEFEKNVLIYSMSEVIDHLDEVMAKIFHQIGQKTEILIGDNNPFGEMSAVVISKCLVDGGEHTFGVLGPMRMNYSEIIGLVDYSKNILSKLKQNS